MPANSLPGEGSLHCLQMATFLLCPPMVERENELSGTSSHKTLILLNQGPTLLTSFNPNYLPIGPISNAVTLGVRASTGLIFGGERSSVHSTFLLDKLKSLDMILFVSYMLFVLKSTFSDVIIYSYMLSYA